MQGAINKGTRQNASNAQGAMKTGGNKQGVHCLAAQGAVRAGSNKKQGRCKQPAQAIIKAGGNKNSTQWRLIVDSARDAFSNMAIDKAILFAGKQPTVRFYSWQPAAVSIGCFQSLLLEVDTLKCREQNIDVVRRITGGGAVFHDKELTYSIVLREKNKFLPGNLLVSYEKICSAVIAGLSVLGLRAEYAPLNDILVNGKKVSGCAQTRRNKGVLQHGTMIMGVDVEKMFSLLRVPDEKIRGKMIASAKERVTSIEKELGRIVSFAEAAAALKKGFEQTFGMELVAGNLTEKELLLATEFRKEFASNEWNYSR
jgi:lipoate-protein ligase A